MNEWLNGLGHTVMLWYVIYYVMVSYVMLCYAVVVLFVA